MLSITKWYNRMITQTLWFILWGLVVTVIAIYNHNMFISKWWLSLNHSLLLSAPCFVDKTQTLDFLHDWANAFVSAIVWVCNQWIVVFKPTKRSDRQIIKYFNFYSHPHRLLRNRIPVLQSELEKFIGCLFIRILWISVFINIHYFMLWLFGLDFDIQTSFCTHIKVFSWFRGNN